MAIRNTSLGIILYSNKRSPLAGTFFRPTPAAPHRSRSGLALAIALLAIARAADGAAPQPAAGDASAVVLPGMTVTDDLDLAREEIAPGLGAVTYSVGSDQIETMGQGESSSLQQVLLQLPGMVQDEFGETHVRGDHGDLQYRVNGVLLPESLNGFGQEVDTHLIQSVSLLTGTLPAQFGDRTAGIIDVTTKTGSQIDGGELSFYGGGYGTASPSLQSGGTAGDLEYFTSVSFQSDNLGIDNTTPSTEPLHDRTEQERLFGYFSRKIDPTSRLTLLVSSSDAEFQIPDTPGVAPLYELKNGPAPDSASADNHQHEQNYYVVLSYQKSAGFISFQVSAFSRYTDIDFTPDLAQSLLLAGTAAQVDNSDIASGVQIDGSCQLGNSHTLRAGMLANVDLERLDTVSAVFPSGSQFTASPTGETLPLPGGPAPLPGNPPQSSTIPFDITADGGNSGLTAGFYLQDEWELTDRLTLNYGFRYDVFDVSFEDEWQASPRANLVWNFDGTTSLHAGYARYFMPPTLQFVPLATVREFEYTTDAPFNGRDDPPRVERDNYFDGGISWQPVPGCQLTGDAFCKRARNLLDDGQFGTAVILNNFNYPSGTVYGAELGGAWKLGALSAYANFSYVQTWAHGVNSVENEFPDNELAYFASNPIQLDHQGKYSGSGGVTCAIFKDTRLYSDFLYGNGLRAGFANLEKLPAYWMANAGIEHLWHLHSKGIRELKLRLDCINAFNTAYEIRNGTGVGIAAPAYGPRRSFYGGLTLVF
jgi:outer membrane receptor protein involved in Fe transport